MISVANRIPVHPDHAAAFEERFLSRPRMVETMPGFLFSHLLRPTQDGDPYVVLTFWDSRESFDAWVGSPAFKEGHKGGQTLPREAFAGPNKLEVHEVFSSSEAER